MDDKICRIVENLEGNCVEKSAAISTAEHPA
jgi:hypothetical protein